MFKGTCEKNLPAQKRGLRISEPERLLAALWTKIPPYIRLTFVSAFIAGLLAHFYVISRKLPNLDDIGHLFDATYGAASGRWLLPVVERLDGSFSTPWLIGILAIAMLSVSACFVCSVLRIRRALCCVLTAAVMVSFPAVTATMTYMFSADAYFLALALACFAAYITHKFRFGFIAGAAAITLSMGIYQGYFGMAALLMAGALLLDTLDGKEPVKRLVLKGVKYILTLAFGLLLYLIIVTLSTRFVALVSYMGISEMGRVSVSRLPQLVCSAYLAYARFFLQDGAYVHFSFLKYLFLLTAAACLVLGILIIRLKKLPVKHVVLLLALVALYPLAGNLIYVMVPDAPIHTLMLYGMTGILIAPPALICYYDKTAREAPAAPKAHPHGNLSAVCRWVIVLTLGVTAFSYTVFSNEAYLKMALSYDQSYAFSVRLLGAVESTEGYDRNTPVILVGAPLDELAYPPTPELDGLELTGVEDMPALIGSYTYGYFLRRYVGASNIIYDSACALSEKYEKTAAVRAMPVYPAQGGIALYDGYIIVKLG